MLQPFFSCQKYTKEWGLIIMNDYELQMKVLSDMATKPTEIKELNDEIEVKEVEVKTKQIDVNFSGNLDFKFDQVQLDQYGQVAYTDYQIVFEQFKGMDNEIKSIEADYRKVETSGRYSKQFIDEARIDAIANIVDVKSKYYSKAKQKIEELRKPVMTTATMSDSTMLQNLLKRLNNNVVCSELMRTATIEDLSSLYENNKENIEVRTMIKSRSLHLSRVTKDRQVKDKAYKLYAKIHQFEKELKNEDYFMELDKIELNLKYLFESQSNSNYYPTSLENGFTGFRSKKFFS